jgi:hypothetical protein
MKRKFYSLAICLCAVLTILSLADVSYGQRNKNRRESRNKMMNKAQVKAVINRVEDRIDNFTSKYDDSLDKSKLDGSSREDWLMKRARDLEGATDELAREFDRRDAWAENKDEVRKCLDIATDINRNMSNYYFGEATESNWSRVRFELNMLADIYNLPKVGAATYK